MPQEKLRLRKDIVESRLIDAYHAHQSIISTQESICPYNALGPLPSAVVSPRQRTFSCVAIYRCVCLLGEKQCLMSL